MFPASRTAVSDLERRRLAGVIVLALLVITLPYFWAVLITPSGFQYSGLLYNPDDQNVHLTWMRQAMQGHFFYPSLYTTENLGDNAVPLYTNLFCWLLGILAALTHIPLILIYHAARLLFTALALRWFYGFCALLTNDTRVRLIAVCLAAFSSGAGWLVELIPALGSHVFIDRAGEPLVMPEAFTFLSAMIFPLFIVSMALLTLIYGLTLRAGQESQPRYALGAGIAALLLGNIHTYDALPLIATLLLWAGLTWRQNRKATKQWTAPLIVAGFAIVPVVYQWLVFRNSVEFQEKALIKTLPPSLPDIMLSYGLVLVLAVTGMIVARRDVRLRVPVLWMIVTLAAIYTPQLSFARKMIEGVHLPMCFLAAVGLAWLMEKAPASSMKRLIAGATIGICSISSALFILWCIGNAQDNNTSRVAALMPPLYLPGDDAAALHFLSANVPQPERAGAVLCLPFMGNYVPPRTGLHVYAGHWGETRFYSRKIGEVVGFYTGATAPAQAQAWLHANHIGYVMEGFYETQLIEGRTPPSQRLGLKRLWSQGGCAIYGVP